MAKLRLRVFAALATGILITIGGCSEQSPPFDAGPDDGSKYEKLELPATARGPLAGDRNIRAEKVIGPEGGTLEIPGGHSLAFPAGALRSPTRIRATVDNRYVGVDLQPEGLRFPTGNGPMLTINYGGVNTDRFSALTVLYVAPSGTVLEALPSNANRPATTISARLSHFSAYLVAGH